MAATAASGTGADPIGWLVSGFVRRLCSQFERLRSSSALEVQRARFDAAQRHVYEQMTAEVRAREAALEERADELRTWAHTSSVAMRRVLAKERADSRHVQSHHMPQPASASESDDFRPARPAATTTTTLESARDAPVVTPFAVAPSRGHETGQPLRSVPSVAYAAAPGAVYAAQPARCARSAGHKRQDDLLVASPPLAPPPDLGAAYPPRASPSLSEMIEEARARCSHEVDAIRRTIQP